MVVWQLYLLLVTQLQCPAMIGQIVPSFSPYVKLATVQISCAAVLSAILCPFIVQWFAKRFGCPRYEENFGEKQSILTSNGALKL